ncbi:hypothetical protein RIB2604_00101150 [Aspergillus luchuensis]|uniref:Uncharacterized protein n=1 Tax=Aspergillus kawachii TaxID=1069201 RepID=A0A146EYD8_ASPKA|nr:hypothetical protein RIB2604_00101150 [Aspergillus luchuensis]
MLALQYPLIVTICDVLTAQINRAHDLIGRPVIKLKALPAGRAGTFFQLNSSTVITVLSPLALQLVPWTSITKNLERLRGLPSLGFSKW